MKVIEKVSERILSLFSNDGKSMSSKRFVGTLAWMVILWNYNKCADRGMDLPACTDMIAWAASTMIGLGSVCKVFQNGKNSKEKD